MRYAAYVPCILAGVIVSSSLASGKESKRDKRVYYSVVQITGMDRSIAYEILENKMVSGRRKELVKEYRDAAIAWQRQAAEFRKDKANRGKAYDEPRPSMPLFTVVKQNVRGKEAAEKFVAELEARHSVIKIKGMDGKTTCEAVQSMKLGARMTEVQAEYRDAMKAWSEEAAAFKKENSGKSYTEPRPRKPSVIVVRRDLKDQATAEELASKLQALQAALDKKKH
ncbi:MAG: hypothetical protein ACYSU0_19730 [Planctomycetota bacterium]|jgi:hypothetical protein